MCPYEIFDHTADVGLRIRGENTRELFTSAGRALFDQITDIRRFEKSGTEKSVHFSLKAENLESLFLAWLRELLYTFSTQHLVLVKYQWQALDETHLEADALGYVFDPKRHDQKCEVKAVTYHDYKLEKTKQGFVAEVILDI